MASNQHANAGLFALYGSIAGPPARFIIAERWKVKQEPVCLPCIRDPSFAGPGVVDSGILQSLVSYRVTPQVLTSSTPEVVLEWRLGLADARCIGGSVAGRSGLDLHDDGAGGDKVASDGTYSARFSTAGLLASMRADDVFRVLIGFVNAFKGKPRSCGRLRGRVYLGNPMARLPAMAQPSAPITS